jgi:hypothetical protein
MFSSHPEFRSGILGLVIAIAPTILPSNAGGGSREGQALVQAIPTPRHNNKNQPKKLMKTHKNLTLAIVCATSTLFTQLHAQTFQLSRQLGQLQITAWDGGEGGYIGSLFVPASTLNETVYIDPNNLTIRQVGTITLPALTGSPISLHEIRQVIINQFPNPPVTNTVAADVSLSASLSNPTLSFDTGNRSMHWNGSAYVFSGDVSIQLGLAISYSLATGSQTFTGSPQVFLNMLLQTGSTVDTSDYPNSINLLPDAFWGFNNSPSLAHITADNGFTSSLFVAPVPEPSAFALGILALAAYRVFRRGR